MEPPRRHDPALAAGLRGRGRQPLRRDARRGARRPAPDAVDGHRRGAAAHACTATTRPRPRRAAAPPARRRCCSCRRWPRPRSASTCAAAARSPSTSCSAGARPTSSTTARSSSPTARSASSTGSTTSCRARSGPRRRTRAAPVAARRLVPGRDPLAAGARRRREAAGRLGGADREPVRLLQGPARRAAAPDRGGHRRRGDHAALPPAGRRARAAGQARLPDGGHRQVPDEAVDRALEPP